MRKPGVFFFDILLEIVYPTAGILSKVFSKIFSMRLAQVLRSLELGALALPFPVA